MANITIKSFREQTSALYEDYDAGFAGRPRATRDLAVLDEIIERLEKLINEARADDQLRATPSFVEILETAVTNLNTYKAERDAIAERQANPGMVRLAEAMSKAERLGGVYFRHFAGQNRATRDVRLLEELIEETSAVLAVIEQVASEGVDDVVGDVTMLNNQLDMYRGEVQAIRNAQLGGTIEERIGMLAQLANNQFAIYNTQFAGKNRATRRPELLVRIIENLEDYCKQMRTIQENVNVTSPTNTTNITVVNDNLNLYREELRQIWSVRAGISPAELAGQLGAAANDVMAEYHEHFAGKARSTRDLGRLNALCDGLWEISRQMEALLPNEDLDFNASNLVKVNESWLTYEREYPLVKAAISGDPTDA